VIAPDICAPCRYWHSNDGDGLDAAGAAALAEVLRKEVYAGRTANYAATAFPEEEDLHLFVENVTDFIAFLRKSGGFSIW
jgi:hypothetical protein